MIYNKDFLLFFFSLQNTEVLLRLMVQLWRESCGCMFQKCLVCPAWGPWRSSARLRDGSHVSGVTLFFGILGGCVATGATTDLYCIYLYLLYKHVSTDVFIVFVFNTADHRCKISGLCHHYRQWWLQGVHGLKPCRLEPSKRLLPMKSNPTPVSMYTLTLSPIMMEVENV